MQGNITPPQHKGKQCWELVSLCYLLDDIRVYQNWSIVKGNGGENLNFPEFLREKMRENHETAYRLAKEIGVSQSTIANWLEGRTFPQLAHLGKLEAHYQCKIAVNGRD